MSVHASVHAAGGGRIAGAACGGDYGAAPGTGRGGPDKEARGEQACTVSHILLQFVVRASYPYFSVTPRSSVPGIATVNCQALLLQYDVTNLRFHLFFPSKPPLHLSSSLPNTKLD